MKAQKNFKTLRNESGFTLIELIMVIAILGILAAAGLPQYVDLVGQAEDASAEGISGAVRSGIGIILSENLATGATDTFPTDLDAGTTTNGVCSTSNPCFGTVLQYPITDSTWTRTAQHAWTHDGSGQNCTYTVATGVFACS